MTRAEFDKLPISRAARASLTASEAAGLAAEAAWAKYAAEVGVDRRLLVRAACACARVALPALRQDRRLAEAEIEAAEAWSRGEISLDRVRAGAKAALAAYHAANTAPDGGYRRSGDGDDGFYAAYAAAACAFLEGEEYAEAAYHAAYAAHSACSRLRWSREYAEAEKETAQRVRALIPPPTLQGEE